MKLWKHILVVLISLTVLAGCASKKGGSSSGPYVPPGVGPGLGPGSNWQWGATTSLKIESLSRMSEYAQRPMNNPTNVRINVNLKGYGQGYGGHITIRYKENGKQITTYFTSGSSAEEVKYNIWKNGWPNGKEGFHGFFEDTYGGFILVIDSTDDMGDGGGFASGNGSIWFKNFGYSTFIHPPVRCWFVSLGPFDCRAWPTDRDVDTNRALYPDNGYKKLGTFVGLNLKDAFNDEL